MAGHVGVIIITSAPRREPFLFLIANFSAHFSVFSQLMQKKRKSRNNFHFFSIYLHHNNQIDKIMSYTEMAQLELMNAAVNITSKEDLDALRLTLSLFFAERAQKAIDRMWDEGTLDQRKLDELRGKHLRTPYKSH